MNQTLEKPETNLSNVSIKKIVVAVDLSAHSRKTAAYAAQFAKSFGASLTLVHAFAPERITEFTTEEIHERYESEMQDTARDLDKLAAAVRKTYPDCDTEFLIAKDLNADLIVTASHHPDFLSRLFGTDQAPRILHRAQCPVLVYHEGNE